ncbi:MAG: hypothetical protein M3323_00955 [Actinomycetota bacterium]|nr:hypothetical protein [Actinomycetota bacterium]
MTVALVLGVAAGIAGCGSSEGYNPVILAEQIAREFTKDLQNTNLVVSECLIAEDGSYTCVGEGYRATQITGSIAEDGQFDALSAADGAAWAGEYPDDTAYRGLDLAELANQIEERAVALDLIAPEEPPECSVGMFPDRAFYCILDDPDRQTSDIGALRVDLIVAEDGSYTAESTDGPTEFEGTLTEDVMTDSASD